MYDIDGTVAGVNGFLSSEPTLSSVSFVLAYTVRNKPFPLISPVVAVGLDKYEEADVDPVYYDGSTVVLYNHITKVRVGFDIFVPLTSSGYRCLDIFHRMCTRLFETGNPYNFTSAGCSNVKYKRDEAAFVIHGWVQKDIKTRV